MELGGAERLLVSLALAQHEGNHSVEVFTLLNAGRQKSILEVAGISVREFGLELGLAHKLKALFSLRSALRTSDADIVHAWMYHAGLLASLFVRDKSRVIMAIHHTNPFDTGLSFLTRVIAGGCLIASRVCGAVVYVAAASKFAHERAGFSRSQGSIVMVGADNSKMEPASGAARALARSSWALAQDAIVVAHVARFHPDKDQETLLEAFFLAVKKFPAMHLLLVGRGLEQSNMELVGLTKRLGIQNEVSLVGELDSPLEAFHASDIFCLSSRTEAFPVSLVESLQCGLTPVVTDVGACRAVAGKVGFVAPPMSAQGLSEALCAAAGSTTWPADPAIRTQGLQYGLSRMCGEYQALYETTLKASRL